jgi:hypothetical protein
MKYIALDGCLSCTKKNWFYYLQNIWRLFAGQMFKRRWIFEEVIRNWVVVERSGRASWLLRDTAVIRTAMGTTTWATQLQKLTFQFKPHPLSPSILHREHTSKFSMFNFNVYSIFFFQLSIVLISPTTVILQSCLNIYLLFRLQRPRNKNRRNGNYFMKNTKKRKFLNAAN